MSFHTNIRDEKHGASTEVLGCTPPDDAWVRNPDGTCRLVR